MKVFVKIQKKKFGKGGGGGGLVEGWVRVDVNGMLGEGGDVGYGGCEPRVEGIVQGTKRYCTILRKYKKCGGGGEGQYLNQKHSLCIQKRKRKKKVKKKRKYFLTEPVLDPTTSGFEIH